MNLSGVIRHNESVGICAADAGPEVDCSSSNVGDIVSADSVCREATIVIPVDLTEHEKELADFDSIISIMSHGEEFLIRP
jgi:hypothetical protein